MSNDLRTPINKIDVKIKMNNGLILFYCKVLTPPNVRVSDHIEDPNMFLKVEMSDGVRMLNKLSIESIILLGDD